MARAQAGVFTRNDALVAGLTPAEIRRRVRSGQWLVPAHGVLRAATTPNGIDARERAALAPSVRVVRSRHLPDEAVRWVDGAPVLEPARTVVDLAQYLDRRPLTAVALQAMQRELCTYDQITAWRDRLAGRAGIVNVNAMLEEADPAFESILAAEFGQLVSSAGILLVPSYRLELPDGRHVKCDFADPMARIDFEVDGFAYHSSPRQVAADRERDRRLLRARWITVRYSTDDIRRHPTRTLADVLHHIAERRHS